MLKISEGSPGEGPIALRLEGRVVGPWVDELRQICEPLVSDGSKLALDLTDVSFADENGVTLLSHLQLRGAELVNVTPFIEQQLKSAAHD